MERGGGPGGQPYLTEKSIDIPNEVVIKVKLSIIITSQKRVKNAHFWAHILFGWPLTNFLLDLRNAGSLYFKFLLSLGHLLK